MLRSQRDYGQELQASKKLKTFDPGQRARRLGTALLLLLLPALPVQARGKSEAWANTQFSNAERLRESLNTLPAKERSRHEYHARHQCLPPGLLRRSGFRQGGSQRGCSRRSAGGDGTLFQQSATICVPPSASTSSSGANIPVAATVSTLLFNIAQIYQDDLNNRPQARPIFEEFLRRYPHNHLADAAEARLPSRCSRLR